MSFKNFIPGENMKMLEIDEIDVSNKYLRLKTNVDTLMQSIETVGLIHPLVVNKENKLIAGGRRYSALKALGWQKIPVVIIDKGELEQELISIEENIIREKLSAVEFEACLRRAKQIYDELYPEAQEDLDQPIEDEEIETRLENGERVPFAVDIANKVGMTPQAVRSAIKRDIESSSKVKKARENKEINSTQASLLSGLDKETQNNLLDVIVEKNLDSSDVRKLVKKTYEMGAEQATEELLATDPIIKDYVNLTKSVKKISKEFQKVVEENSTYEGKELDKVLAECELLKSLIEEFLGQH